MNYIGENKSWFRLFVIAFVCLLLFAQQAYSQANPEVSNCEELRDEATITQAEICKTHPGCRLVYAIQSACTRAKQFINNLKERLDQGTKTLFGRNKEIDSNSVFDAALSREAKAAEQSDKAWQAKTSEIRQEVSKAATTTVAGKDGSGQDWVYVGDARGQTPEGWGAKFYSNGTIERGEYKGGVQSGTLDMYEGRMGERQTGNAQGAILNGPGYQSYNDGSRYSGDLLNGRREGRGTYTLQDGTKIVGGWANDNRFGSSTTFRPDGTVSEKGLFDRSGTMTIGQVFDASGKVSKDVNTAKGELQTAETIAIENRLREQRELAAKRAEAERQAELRRVEQQRQAELQAKAEREFRESLNTLNAGQLFAKADQLSSGGDKTKAREVLQALLSRFPDHPLAATAAQQMATMSAASVNSSSNAIAANATVSPQSGQTLGAIITSGDACGKNGQAVINAIITRYERFRDPTIQGIVQDVKRTSLADNVRNMISRGGGLQGAIQGVAGEVKNNQLQMVTAADGYCKINAGCSDYRSLGWPDNMATNLLGGSSASASLASAYVAVSLMHDLNSVTLRALRCSP